MSGLGTYTTFSIGPLLVEINSNHSSNKQNAIMYRDVSDDTQQKPLIRNISSKE